MNMTYKDMFMVKPDRFVKKQTKRDVKTEGRWRENNGNTEGR